MLAMLLAMALCRAARPAAATRSDDDERSSNTAAPWASARAPIHGCSLSNPCSYQAVRPGRLSAECVVVAAGLHTKRSRCPLGGSPGTFSFRLHGAVDVDRPLDRFAGLDPGG